MTQLFENIKQLEKEVVFSFARSSGPGGQNVNKVNTKAILCWNVFTSEAVSTSVRNRFKSKYENRLREDGTIVIQCDQTRSQPQNIQTCVDRLVEMIQSVLQPPKPRKKTKPSRRAKEKRLQMKKEQSDRKSSRKKVVF